MLAWRWLLASRWQLLKQVPHGEPETGAPCARPQSATQQALAGQARPLKQRERQPWRQEHLKAWRLQEQERQALQWQQAGKRLQLVQQQRELAQQQQQQLELVPASAQQWLQARLLPAPC